MKSGAVDFLTKPVDREQLVAAVAVGLERSARIEVERRLHDVFVERVDRLTPREREVAIGLIRGLLNKQIASELGTTEKTIKVHGVGVMAKLEVGSVAELVRLVENANRADVVMAIGSAARAAADSLLVPRRFRLRRSAEVAIDVLKRGTRCTSWARWCSPLGAESRRTCQSWHES